MKIKRFIKDQAVLLLFLFFIAIMIVFKPSFVTLTNIKNVLIDTSIYGVTALAMTIAIITGAFDLSVSANFAWGQIFFCYLLNLWGGSAMGILASFIVMVLSCTAIGCVNGLIIVLGKIPAFIATLGMSTIIKGSCLLFTSGDMIATTNAFVTMMGKGTFLGISYLTWIFAVIVVIAWYFMKYTTFGRALYATGGNYEAAKLSGIRVSICQFSTFAILGLAAGISGAMFVCQMRAGSVLYGTDLSLTCVAATVVGGTPLTGGKGSVLRSVLGILLIYVLYKGLAFLGLQGYYNTMIRGVVLLAVVSFDAFMTRNNK